MFVSMNLTCPAMYMGLLILVFASGTGVVFEIFFRTGDKFRHVYGVLGFLLLIQWSGLWCLCFNITVERYKHAAMSELVTSLKGKSSWCIPKDLTLTFFIVWFYGSVCDAKVVSLCTSWVCLRGSECVYEAEGLWYFCALSVLLWGSFVSGIIVLGVCLQYCSFSVTHFSCGARSQQQLGLAFEAWWDATAPGSLASEPSGQQLLNSVSISRHSWRGRSFLTWH